MFCCYCVNLLQKSWEFIYFLRKLVPLSGAPYKIESGGHVGGRTAPLWFGLYKCSSKTSSLNSKGKQERTNTSLLSVNVKTNTKADKHRVEQSEYDNKQVGQIMSNTEQKNK